MLHLYHWEPNSYSLSPLLALYEKDIAFEGRYVDFLAFEQYRQPAFADEDEYILNLEVEAPVLVDGDRPVTDTFFMGLYIDETYVDEPRLTPPGPEGRWQALAWARHIGEVLAPSVITLGCHAFLSPRLSKRNDETLQSAIAALPTEERRTAWRMAAGNGYTDELLADSRRKLDLSSGKVEKALAGGDWVCGPFSLVDIELFAHLNSAPLLAPEIVSTGTTPRLMAWLERIRDRPACAKAMSHAHSLEPQKAFAPGAEHSRWG